MVKETEYFPKGFLHDLIKKDVEEASESEWPQISIVMPTFNQEMFIERSILSVLNQRYPNLQLIIIDGGSSDGTLDVINRYADHIDYWVSEEDQGQSDALNKGFAKADGEIFGWLNSDDLYLPGALLGAATALVRDPRKMIVFGDWLSIDEHDKLLDYNHAFDFSTNHFKYEGFHLNAQSMFWRRDVHDHFSGFDLSLYNTMDYQMILEFGIHFGDSVFLRVPQAFGAFRRYEGQKTSGFSGRVASEHRRLADHYHYPDKYTQVGKIKRFLFRLRRGYWYFRRGGLVELVLRAKRAYLPRRL